MNGQKRARRDDERELSWPDDRGTHGWPAGRITQLHSALQSITET